MKRLSLSMLLMMVLSGPLWGQSVTLPKEVKGNPGAWVVVVPDAKDGGEIKWRVGKGLDLVPLDKLFPGQKSAGIVVTGKTGVYEVWAWTAKGDVASELAVCKIVIGDAPEPGPTPDPKPPTPPDPPAPIEGKRCLIIYETSEASRMPEKQQQILYGRAVREYLDNKCVVEPDGKTRAWRIWDKDVDTTAESKTWQEAMKRPRTATPWLILSNGKTGYEGPLPATAEEFLTLARKYLD